MKRVRYQKTVNTRLKFHPRPSLPPTPPYPASLALGAWRSSRWTCAGRRRWEQRPEEGRRSDVSSSLTVLLPLLPRSSTLGAPGACSLRWNCIDRRRPEEERQPKAGRRHWERHPEEERRPDVSSSLAVPLPLLSRSSTLGVSDHSPRVGSGAGGMVCMVRHCPKVLCGNHEDIDVRKGGETLFQMQMEDIYNTRIKSSPSAQDLAFSEANER